MDNNLIPYQPVISDIKNLITVGQNITYNAANRAMIMTYWNIGKRIRFLYKGIIIKHNKTEPTYTKTSLFLCEKRRFFMARTEKGVVTTI